MKNDGVGSWPHRRRRKSAGRVALVTRDREVTYDALAERADRLADALAQRGLERGGRVAYLGENDPAFLETLFAAGLLGAVFVPLNTRLAAPEIQYALQHSGATVLVVAAELSQLAEAALAGTQVEHLVVVGTAPLPAGAEGYEEVVAGGAPEHRDVPVSRADPAIILYTSGTTGRPKGAVLSHGNLTWNSINVLVDYDVASTDVALMISPMFHVASLGMGVLPVLLKGGTVVLEQGFEAGRALALIAQHRATMISGVPTTYQLMAEHPDWHATDISSLRKLTCGGSTVPLRTIEAYEQRGLHFSQGYGMTETAPGATALMPTHTRTKIGSVGLPHFFTDVRVVDVAGEPVAPGVVGEVQIEGPNVIAEYWNTSDGAAFTEDGWFRSGDLGYRDEDGFLFIADRLKDMIISGGENIYPAEVEQLVNELEAVASVAVIGRPDERWGEVPLAVISVREGYSLTAEDVRKHLDGRLARYKIPKTIVFVQEMPRTASGKIRKATLREQFSRPVPAHDGPGSR